MIKYSVVIPAYNIEAYVPSLISFIDTVLRYRDDVEFIIVNDGSEDETHTMLNKVEYIVYYEQLNQGVSCARNRGIELSKGEFILFLDADDSYTHNIFLILDKAIKDYGNFNIYMYNYYINGKVQNTIMKEGEYSADSLLWEYFNKSFSLHICSICFRKKFIANNNICFKSGFAWAEDLHFVLKSLLLSDKNILFIKEPLYSYVIHADGTMKNIVTHSKAISLTIRNDISDMINSRHSLVTIYRYYEQRYFLFMIKKALINNVDSLETLSVYKDNLPILDKKVRAKTTIVFKLSRFVMKNFSTFVFYVIKKKSKI